MQKSLLAFLFLLLITQSCGLDDFMEEEIPILNTVPASLELFGKQNEPLVLDFSKILDFSQPLSLKIKKKPLQGTLTFVEKSTFLIYQPNDSSSSNYDTFTYEVTYNTNQVIEGEIFVNLYNENTSIGMDSCKIKAAYDYAQIPPNNTLSLNILENDIFCNANIDISATLINIDAQHGTLVLNNGQVTYTPDENFTGTDRFIYSTCTNNGDCASAIVEILIKEIPKCVFELENDKYTVALNNQVLDSAIWLWEVFQNDNLCDDEVDWNTFKITKPALHGDASIIRTDSIKAVSFVPNFDFDGQDIFTYEVCDFSGTCYSANVQIDINNNIDFSATLNDDLIFFKTTNKQELAVLLNDQIDKNTIDWTTFNVKNSPQNGIARTEKNSNGEYILSYMPNQNFSNVDKLSYSLCLFSGECFEAEVKILVQPDSYICPAVVPTAKNDTIIFNNGQNETDFLVIPVLENDDFCFAKVDWKTFEIVTAPKYGSTQINIGENIRYSFDTESSNEAVSQDEFTYRWSQNGQTFEATVLIKFESNAYTCADIITVDSLNTNDFDSNIIVSAHIENDLLFTTIQYVGGCDYALNIHYLVIKRESFNQNTPTYDLEYLFKDVGACKFLVQEKRCFDLSVFKTNPNGGRVIIKLKNYKKLVYKY